MSGHFKAFRKRSRAGGFTLLEIVVVLILLGILASVAIAHYFDVSEEAAQKAAQAAVAEIQARIDSEFTTRIVRGEKCSVAREYASNLANVADSVGSGAVATAADDETGSADRVLKFGEFTVTDSSAWNSGQKKITVTIETHTFRQQGPLIQPTCEDTDESSSSGDSSSGGGSDSGSGGGTDTGGTDTDSGDNSGTDTGDKGTGDDDDDGDSGSNRIITALKEIGAASYEDIREKFAKTTEETVNYVSIPWKYKDTDGFLFYSSYTKSYYVAYQGISFSRKNITVNIEQNVDYTDKEQNSAAHKIDTSLTNLYTVEKKDNWPLYAYFKDSDGNAVNGAMPVGALIFVEQSENTGKYDLYYLMKSLNQTDQGWAGPGTREGTWVKLLNADPYLITGRYNPYGDNQN